MRVESSIRFGEEDESDIRRILGFCSEAANFFEPPGDPDVKGRRSRGGLEKAEWLRAGHTLSLGQLREVRGAVQAAREAVAGRRPHGAFPAELRERYLENLQWCGRVVSSWVSAMEAAERAVGRAS